MVKTILTLLSNKQTRRIFFYLHENRYLTIVPENRTSANKFYVSILNYLLRYICISLFTLNILYSSRMLLFENQILRFCMRIRLPYVYAVLFYNCYSLYKVHSTVGFLCVFFFVFRRICSVKYLT